MVLLVVNPKVIPDVALFAPKSIKGVVRLVVVLLELLLLLVLELELELPVELLLEPFNPPVAE